jgi:hypothetical protein
MILMGQRYSRLSKEPTSVLSDCLRILEVYITQRPEPIEIVHKLWTLLESAEDEDLTVSILKVLVNAYRTSKTCPLDSKIIDLLFGKMESVKSRSGSHSDDIIQLIAGVLMNMIKFYPKAESLILKSKIKGFDTVVSTYKIKLDACEVNSFNTAGRGIITVVADPSYAHSLAHGQEVCQVCACQAG